MYFILDEKKVAKSKLEEMTACRETLEASIETLRFEADELRMVLESSEEIKEDMSKKLDALMSDKENLDRQFGDLQSEWNFIHSVS